MPSGMITETCVHEIGFAYGGLWGVVPVLILELFGPSNFGTLVGCCNSIRWCFIPSGVMSASLAYHTVFVATGE